MLVSSAGQLEKKQVLKGTECGYKKVQGTCFSHMTVFLWWTDKMVQPNRRSCLVSTNLGIGRSIHHFYVW